MATKIISTTPESEILSTKNFDAPRELLYEA